MNVAGPVDIILLSYNRVDYLAEMVAALAERTRWPHRLTVVDNASGPATRQWLRENSARFHQIVWNAHNEHLAGLQRGIAATAGELFVVSDADLVVSPPTQDGCWLTRLIALAERHPDFGLIGVRLDSVSAARNAQLERAPLVDGELLETPTGVWLNLIRRSALRIPYMSDGITCHALRRAGYRVGIAAAVYATHLGDDDPRRHPDYLARKQASSGWRTTYPVYDELDGGAPPPTTLAVALAAPVLAALARHGIATDQAVELCTPHRVIGAVDADVQPAQTVAPGSSIVLVDRSADGGSLRMALASPAERVVALSAVAAPPSAPGWKLAGEHPGPHPVALALARIASRPRWRRRLLYSTSEHREQWLALFRAACFGEQPALRLYVYERTAPATGPPVQWASPAGRSPFQPAVRIPRSRIGTVATKLRRLVRAEWRLARGSGR